MSDDDTPRTGPFSDPLKTWPNDDLMLKEEFRDALREENEALFNVLDWPELREKFERHDKPAGRGKKISHMQGLAAIGLAGIGIILIGAIPALPHDLERDLSIVALGAMGLGGLLGLVHWLVLRSRSTWLGNRFWTERLRQLYFQSLVGNLELTAQAMTDPDSLEELKKYRAKWLREFYVDPQDPRDRIREIVLDRAESGIWLRPEWREHHVLHNPPAAIHVLLDALHRQRIEIQHYYAGKNLGPDVYSPGTRAKILRSIGQLCTVLVVIAAAIGGISYGYEIRIMCGNGLTWAAVAAVLSAVGLTARAADEGLQNETDADRYEWYKEAIDELKERYEHDRSVGPRMQELRRMEEITYQELRRFLRTHGGARFLM